MDDLNKIEEDLKNKELEKKKTKHKVSGRSVFQIKKIITNKVENNEESSREENIVKDDAQESGDKWTQN